MTQDIGGYPQPQSEPRRSPDSPSTTDVAREEAANVGRTAVETGGQVTQTATEQAKQVASETGRQARDLMNEGMGQIRNQASDGQKKAAGGLHTLADQLREMAENSSGSGVAADLARQASERAHGVASWLEAREPGDLLNEVRDFARRRPGLFLAGSALAGALVGRLTKGATAAQTSRPGAGGTVGGPPLQADPVRTRDTYTTAGGVGQAIPPATSDIPYAEQAPGGPVQGSGTLGYPPEGAVRP